MLYVVILSDSSKFVFPALFNEFLVLINTWKLNIVRSCVDDLSHPVLYFVTVNILCFFVVLI